jgi:hypothetical protein
MMTMNKKDYCVRKAFENIVREAASRGTYKRQAAYNKENCIKVERFNAPGAVGYREVLDGECLIKRESAGSGNNNRRIVDLKTGKTRAEEEYEKTVRLLNLMKEAPYLRYI